MEGIAHGKYASSSSAHHAGLGIFDVEYKSPRVCGGYLSRQMSVTDLKGGAFSSSTTVVTGEGDTQILDFTSLTASDGKFASGMYEAGPQTFDITEPYGVDEFMFFLEGRVTLTSADGSAVTVGAGEAVTIPKEWTGRWQTAGYRKIWVIYSADGSGP